MGLPSKFIAQAILFIVLSLCFVPSSTCLRSNEEGFIYVLISGEGIDFAKDLLIKKAVSSMIPLQLPDIEKYVKIPVIGKAHIVLSNITIYNVNFPASYVETGEGGLILIGSDATANLSMKWAYSYHTWLVPIAISDDGDASVLVEGMDVAIDAALNNQDGSLRLSLLHCGCHVNDISIEVDGGASWLYEGLIDAFQGKIISAVEDAICKKIREGIRKLDSLLQSLPKEKRIDDIASLNVAFVNDPVLSNSSIELEINGLVTAKGHNLFSEYSLKGSQTSYSCNGLPRMVGISIQEYVFNSAAIVYFNAKQMYWIVDKIPDQSTLNTAEWRYIVPQLYEQYPDANMNLNISLTSAPIIRIAANDIDSTIFLDVTIDVLDSGAVVPVACISSVINVSGSAEISRNNLAGSIQLIDFTASLKWSKIGDLQMHLVQEVMSTILETVFFPYVNLRLGRGFPLPLPHGFTLQNPEILCTESRVIVCSDIAFEEQYLLNQLFITYSSHAAFNWE